VKRFLLLYEDPRWERLSPLADLLPVPGLRFGASTLAARWLGALGLPRSRRVPRFWRRGANRLRSRRESPRRTTKSWS
jgi:hypothetical protein